MHLKSAWTGTTGAFHRNRLPRGLQCLVLLCALFLVLVCPPRAQSQQVKGYSHQHWDIEEGAPPDIRAIAQTRDGFLWLGTSNGLYRFDGLTFEKIEPATYDRWRSNQITALAAAPTGPCGSAMTLAGWVSIAMGALRTPMPRPGHAARFGT
jgi:ligand-binding sensor domain-containing protein